MRTYPALILLLSAVIFLFTACSTEPTDSMGVMHNMPCHQMPDGSWMGNCDDVNVDAMDVHDSQEGILPGFSEQFDASPAQPTTVVTLEDGDQYHLTAQVIEKQLGDKTYTMYGYNGQVPGPLFKLPKGASADIIFTNNIDQETTVHWHGLRNDIANDGVPGISQETVKPHESFTYTITVPDQGAFWYHPHVREDIQQDNGLYGNILVTSDDLIAANAEEQLVLDDILIDEEGIIPFGKDHANFALMGRFGKVLLINGQTDYTATYPAGTVVRYYLTNVANVRPFNLSIPGAQIKLVGSDLSYYEQEQFVDHVIVAPAERYIIDVYFDQPGEYSIKNINPHASYTLGKVIITEELVDQDHAANFNQLNEHLMVQQEMDQARAYLDQPSDYNLVLTMEMQGMIGNMGEGMNMDHGSMMIHSAEPIEWEDTMNMMNTMSTTETTSWILLDPATGKTNMDLGWEANVGDKIKITITNDPNSMHPMQHPIHLHGQRFAVLAVDGEPVENMVWKDTSLIETGSVVEILVDVTNPGEWMLHCHISEHLEAGMMGTLNVKP